ncbi:MAG: hypothetical protein KJ915_05510 [Candidatus Omnitrophica bacterium]|nr:hypothetical protein [Candidatus Omnitrophota bacterium]
MLKKIVSIAVVPYVLWLIFAYQYHFIDGANLLFHEAGHLVLSFMGPVVHFLGGTIGQLVFPTVCIISFLKKNQKFEAAICGIWFGENMVNIAWYMGDAQTMMIPLVGGGIHDWNWLLYRAGLLAHCKILAGLVHIIAALILIGSVIVLFQQSFFTDSQQQGNDPDIGF